MSRLPRVARAARQPAAPAPSNGAAASGASGASGSSGSGGANGTASGSAVGGGNGSSAEGGATSSSSAVGTARRVHILPVGNFTEEDDRRRLELLAPALREMRAAKTVIKPGLFLRSEGCEFVVVKAEPEECVLGSETDYHLEGQPIARLEKVQFICLWDFESGNTSQDPGVLFTEYISPYFRSISDSGEDMGSIVSVGSSLKIFGMEFQVMAVEPSPPEIGIVDTNTMVFVDWDATPEFSRIHIVPFQDTLPHAYQFDVFNDYLKPYLTRNKHMKFAANDQFTYQGVQFKVVCCEPVGPARIGRNTTIYCEGVLHPSLRNLLPPELLEQLSHLPPGLQMLLLNTEALAGGYEERLIEVQEMLSRRRGLSNDTITRLEMIRWDTSSSRDFDQTQCMVCLSNFTSGEEVRRLPCNHLFHVNCIDEWLRRCTDCPICKANVDQAVTQH